MVIKPYRLLMLLCLGTLCVTFVRPSGAQADYIAGLTDEQRVILDDLNARRLPENLLHLVPNSVLMQIADDHLTELLGRSLDTLDSFTFRSGGTISSVLTPTNYQTYTTGYFVDFVPAVLFNVPPEQFVEYWLNDARQPTPELPSLRILQGNQRFLPLFDSRYREVGLAYGVSERTGRDYYVLVFASQPNVLPLIIVPDTEDPNVPDDPMIRASLTGSVPTQNVLLYIHDERVNRFGDGGAIGGLRYIRISQQPGELPCPADVGDPWQLYTNEQRYRFPGVGQQQLFVQMCDDNRQTIVSSASITVGDRTPTDNNVLPDVLGIANATQTAAVGATAFQPFAPTVEAILTQTATAIAGEVGATPTPSP